MPSEPNAPDRRPAPGRLRLLDFDDLYLLTHLLAGNTIAATAKQLGLTQPAITQRVRKIERAFGEILLQRVGRHVRLTEAGRAICARAADALTLMGQVAGQRTGSGITIASEPLAAALHLFEALQDLRLGEPDWLFHYHPAAADEMGALLESGGVDAVLTAGRHGGPNLVVQDLAETEFVIVAQPALAEQLALPGGLAKTLFLDLDRSQPLFSRLGAADRVGFVPRGHWYLGDPARVLHGALAGWGLAVLPLLLAQPNLAAGRLVAVYPELELAPLQFRLVYRRATGTDAPLRSLSARLAL